MLEIAVTSFKDAIHAQEGGADSIEISHNLALGGLTPPPDLVRRVRDAVSLDVHVIVRPHARDFVYTLGEIDQILHDTSGLAKIGINSVVFGAQSPDSRLNIDLIKQVKQAADGIPITVHRAIDESVEPEAALVALQSVVPRILTSGPATNTWDGRDGLRRWIADFGDDFSFVASGGLKVDFLADYITHVRAHEYHFGGAARTSKNVDPAKVRQLRDTLDRAQ